MTGKERIKVFIGSGEASRIERKVLIHSLRKNSQRDIDIYVFNGTHNAIELNDEEPFIAPLSLKLKYQNTTEFSLYRFLIPEICNYQGRAIYVDSDTISLTDIGELFDTPMNGFDFLTKKGSYAHRGSNLWGLSVMLLNCEKCRFDLTTIFKEIEQGLYTYSDFSRMSELFLSYHQYNIGEMNPNWNVFDYWDNDTNLIHYTNLYTQPWKFPNHPYGELWFEYFKEARAEGLITEEDFRLSFARAYVRRDLLEGNSPKKPNSADLLLANLKKSLKKSVKKSLQSFSLVK